MNVSNAILSAFRKYMEDGNTFHTRSLDWMQKAETAPSPDNRDFRLRYAAQNQEAAEKAYAKARHFRDRGQPLAS